MAFFYYNCTSRKILPYNIKLRLFTSNVNVLKHALNILEKLFSLFKTLTTCKRDKNNVLESTHTPMRPSNCLR